MASSRKRRPTADPLERSLLAAVKSAVDDALSESAPAPRAARGRARLDVPLVVAYSGGRDSSALLNLACALRDARAPGFGRPHAVHVHHGLHPDADSWVEHCQRQCTAFSVELTVRRVRVERRGLSTMAQQRDFDAAADRAAIVLLRPLLHVPRERIERYIQQKTLEFIEDPGNSDPRFDRSAIRLRVMPELARLRSGFRAAAERSIELIAEGADALRSVAREDLRACTRDAPASMLRIDRLAQLPEARRMLVLREWLAQAGLPAPPRARLREALQQAIHAGADARLLIRIGEHELRRHRGLLCLNAPRRNAPALHALQWQGEPELAVPSWGGTLVFTRTSDEGFDARWLGAEPLELRPRTGGERFKPHPTRPSKRLKQIFQEARIPEYERSALPLVWREGRLIYVAGVGPDTRMLVAEGERVRIDWVGATRLLRD